MSTWPKVSLGDLLRLERRPATVEADKEYEEIGIYCFGRGIFRKRPRSGLEVGDKNLYLLKEGDFILQVTFAWEGAIAIVSKAEDGLYGSTRYPTFRVDEDRCDPRFLLQYFRTHEGLDQIIRICPGSAGRNRVLSIKRIPEVLVPLPPLAEQQRVVARIEELAATIHEARTLRRQADEEAETLVTSASARHFKTKNSNVAVRPIGDTFHFRSDLIRPTDGVSGAVRFVGLQHVESNTGRRIGADSHRKEELAGRKFKFSCGEIVYGYLRPYLNKVWIADGEGVCSVDQYVIQPIQTVADPSYLAHFMRSRCFLDQTTELTHNLMLPRLRSGLLKQIPIPLPSLADQRRIVAELDALQEELDSLKRLQTETAAELDALVPAILDRAFMGEF